MKKNDNVTLKDIAKELGLSIGTVHRAIYNKDGVSEKTRQEILAEIKRSNYKINVAASCLRRPVVNIVAILPEPVGSNRFYFQYVWKGIDQAEKALEGLNVSIIRYTTDFSKEAHLKILQTLLQPDAPEIHAIFTLTWDDPDFNACLDQLFHKNIPVFLINSETTSSRNLCYVSSSYSNSSLLAGETMCAICHHSDGKIIIISGDKDIERHRISTNGFTSYLLKERPNMDIIEVKEFHNEAKARRLLIEYLQKLDDIRGVFSSIARGTLLMCEAVKQADMSGKISTVGSDVFDELIPYFKDKTLSATIYQYPEQQAANGIKILFDHITLNAQHSKTIIAPSSVIFSSNAEFFI